MILWYSTNLPGKMLNSLTISLKNMIRILVSTSDQLSVIFMVELVQDLDLDTL